MALTQVPIELSSTPGIVDNSNATAVTIDSSENVLVGKTSSNAATPGHELKADGAAWHTADSTFPLFLNRETDDGELIRFRKDNSNVGSVACRSSGGNLQIHTNQSGIDFGGDGYLPMRGSTITDNSLDIGSSSFRYKDLYLSRSVILGSGYNVSWGGQYADGAPTIAGSATSDLIAFYPEGATSGEAMRIDSSGNLLVGRTSAGATGNGHSIRGGDSAIFSRDSSGESMIVARNASAGDLVRFYCNGSDRGSIDFDGTNTISYTSSSDQRLKDNIADADDAGSKVDAIQVRKFDWIADGSHQDYGMIAQELQAVAPEAVSGDPDSDEMMGVDYSKLVPMLVKEIQSLRARVAQLENS